MSPNPYPAEFQDADGTVRIAGEIDFTDSGNQPSGSSPVSTFIFDPAGVGDTAPASGASTPLSWKVNPDYPSEDEGGQGGPNPFDITDPSVAVVLAEGVYTFCINVNLQGTFAANKRWFAGMDVTSPAGLLVSPGFSKSLPVTTTVFDQIVFGPWPMAAGTTLAAWLGQNTGSDQECWMTTLVSWWET